MNLFRQEVKVRRSNLDIILKTKLQFFTYLNLDFWQRQQLKNNYSSIVLASSVGLIEQQVPLFINSMFFEWFLKRVIALTRDKALEMGADWGADRIWCSAAIAYALKVLNWIIPAPSAAPSQKAFQRSLGSHESQYYFLYSYRSSRSY